MGKIIYKTDIFDTTFINQDKKSHVSRFYREANWLYFENGIVDYDGSISIIKQEKREVLGMLGTDFDHLFKKSPHK